MEAVRPPRNDTPEKKEKRLASEKERFDRRMEDLGKALDAAKILGCDKVRVFTGSRTADPKSTYPRMVEVFTPMVEEAAKHKIHLLVENEASQNVATSAELGMLVPMLKSPWFGYNWDPNNAHSAKEIPVPRRLQEIAHRPNDEFAGEGARSAARFSRRQYSLARHHGGHAEGRL